MDTKQLRSISKQISFALRHRPDLFGLKPDEQGWCWIEDLLLGLQDRGMDVDYNLLQRVVETNDKQRFSISTDGKRIRANQGHSITVQLGYDPLTPPTVLFHGTAAKNLNSIRKTGLEKRNRHHVHLSADEITAKQVGARHGRPVVLRIKAEQMAVDGHLFFRSANGVWLTDYVTTRYIVFPKSEDGYSEE